MASFSFKRASIASHQQFLLYGLALVISLLSALLSYQGWPENLNWLHFDQTQRFSHLPESDDLVIIEIDDKSLNELGRWPWPRDRHAALLDTLTPASPRTIVFDILFPNADTTKDDSDARFASAIANSGRVILPLYFEALGPQGVIVESPPFQPFYASAAAIGHIHYESSRDGVVRGVALQQGINSPHWPHLALAILQHTHPEQRAPIPGKSTPREPHGNPAIHITKDFYNLLPMPSPQQGIRHFSYSDVLAGKVDRTILKDRVIFIGATATGLGDILVTPAGAMHGVELNAWTFHALKHDQMIQTLMPINIAIITFLVVLILVLGVGRLSPLLFLTFSTIAITGIVIISSMFMLHLKLWFPPSGTIFGIALFFPLWSWLRAESMLNYLQQEIIQIQPNATEHKKAPSQKQEVINYLATLGLIDKQSLHATPAGRNVLQTLIPSSHHSGKPEDFWQTQLTRYEHTRPALPKKYGRGDLITRTLAQLTAIREQDAKNRRLIEQSLSGMQDAICIADLCGQITYTNRHFKQWFLDPEKPDETPALLVLLEQLKQKSGKSWTQALLELYTKGETFYAEAEYRQAPAALGRAKAQYLCQISLVKTNENYRDTLIVAFTDITQLKNAENARSEALSFLSHDLRSPMVSVLAILELYRNKDTTITPTDQQNIASLVRKNLDYAEAFLQLSKAETLPETQMTPCDLHAVLDSAQVHAQALATPKSIAVRTERCREETWALGDMDLLERAVNNLVSNAVKFSPDNTEICLSLKQSNGHLVIAVSDQGPGIPEQEQPELFTKFTRQHGCHSHGIGLGLNFVATVVNKHKGDISVQSTPGKGSTFSISLPALSEQEQQSLFSDD